MTSPLRQREQYAKGGGGRWYWDYRDRRALFLIGQEKVILDVGCGEGITLERVLKEFPGRRVMGVDYSVENVRVCRNHRLPAFLGNAYELQFRNGAVDCCLLLEVIEHLEEPLRALKEIHRVLPQGGLLLLIFPHDWLFKAARLCCGMFREAFAPSGHLKQWSPREMRGNLEAAGFAVQAVAFLPFQFWFSSLHCLMAARKK